MELSFLKVAENFADIKDLHNPERGDAMYSIADNKYKVPRLGLVDSDRLINRAKKVLGKYQAEIIGAVSVDGGDYSEVEAGIKLMTLIDSMLAQDDVNALKYELCEATFIEVNGSFVQLRENLINSKIKCRDDLMAIALVYLEVNASDFFSHRLITSLLQRAQTAD